MVTGLSEEGAYMYLTMDTANRKPNIMIVYNQLNYAAGCYTQSMLLVI